MKRRLLIPAILLSLLVLPAHAGTASAGIEVRFVVMAACTVHAANQATAPEIGCNGATPWRVAQSVAGSGAAWTVTF